MTTGGLAAAEHHAHVDGMGFGSAPNGQRIGMLSLHNLHDGIVYSVGEVVVQDVRVFVVQSDAIIL